MKTTIREHYAYWDGSGHCSLSDEEMIAGALDLLKERSKNWSVKHHIILNNILDNLRRILEDENETIPID